METEAVKDALKLHDDIVRAATRRNEKERDIPDPRHFEQFLEVMESLRPVVEAAARAGTDPKFVGQALFFYSKCLAATTKEA